MKDIVLDNFMRVLDNYAYDFQTLYKQNLLKGDWKASGNLINSVNCSVKENGKTITVQMSLLNYWKYTEIGRGPTRNMGDGTLRLKILQWIEDKGIEPRDNSSLPRQKKLERMSYAIANSIHKNGWKKKSLDKPYITTFNALNDKYMHLFEEALQEDWKNTAIMLWNGLK